MSTPELESSPETAEQTTDESAADSSLRALARQYTLETSGQQSAKPAETLAAKPAAKGKPKTFEELAERLELDVKDLYAIEIPSGKRESEKFTLGQLKDHLDEREEFTVSQLQFEEDRSRKESELVRAQTELQELFASLPETAKKPEIIERVREKHRALLERERKATLDAIPAWRVSAVREKEIAGMVEYLKGYGFPENYLKTVYDHRSMRFIREAWLRETRLRKALEQVTEQKPAAIGKGKPAQGAAPKQSTGRLTRTEQQVQRYLRAINPRVT